MIKKRVPTITCRPWNPVPIKNVLPYTESAIEKDASKYSIPWRTVKYKPKIIVTSKPVTLWLWRLVSIALWHHVTLIPEDNKIIVFNIGTSIGLKTWIPFGGHWDPSSTLGANLAWKKAQKKDKKKKTSDVINRIIPQRNPISTIFVFDGIFHEKEGFKAITQKLLK
jgi:hypothetical protein